MSGSASRRRSARGRVRKGRLLVAAVTVLLAALAVNVVVPLRMPARADATATAAAEGGQPEELVLVVRPGDTAWTLLLPHVPEGEDLMVFVAEVLERNGARAGRLLPGSVLRVPARP